MCARQQVRTDCGLACGPVFGAFGVFGANAVVLSTLWKCVRIMYGIVCRGVHELGSCGWLLSALADPVCTGCLS